MTFLFPFPPIPNGSFPFPFPGSAVSYSHSHSRLLQHCTCLDLWHYPSHHYNGCKTLQPAWSSTLITGHIITTALQQLHWRLVGMLNNKKKSVIYQNLISFSYVYNYSRLSNFSYANTKGTGRSREHTRLGSSQGLLRFNACNITIKRAVHSAVERPLVSFTASHNTVGRQPVCCSRYVIIRLLKLAQRPMTGIACLWSAVCAVPPPVMVSLTRPASVWCA